MKEIRFALLACFFFFFKCCFTVTSIETAIRTIIKDYKYKDCMLGLTLAKDCIYNLCY